MHIGYSFYYYNNWSYNWPVINHQRTSLFQSDDVTPTGGRILAAVIMLDGVSENVCLAFAVATGVLL